MFNRFIFMFLMSLIVHNTTNAQNSILTIKDGDILKLTKVHTPSQKVNIGGALREKGYRFKFNKKIVLERGQYIRVTNMNTGIPNIVISGDDFINTNTNTIKDFILIRYFCGKGKNGFGDFLGSYPWTMLEDTLYIPTNYQLDNTHAFILKTIPGNIILSPVPYDFTTNELVITKNYLIKNNVDIPENGILQFRIEYWEGHTKGQVITDNLIIKYIKEDY